MRLLVLLMFLLVAPGVFAQPKPMRDNPSSLHLRVKTDELKPGQSYEIHVFDRRCLRKDIYIKASHAKVTKCSRRGRWLIVPDGGTGVTVNVFIRQGTFGRKYGAFYLPVDNMPAPGTQSPLRSE